MKAYIKILRIKQWVKNCFVFAGVIFSRKFMNPDDIILSLEAFFTFCMISSTVYIINDILDVEKDSSHPVNRFRPVPSGQITIRGAILLSVFTFLLAIVPALFISKNLFIILILYFVNNLFYSFKLKEIVILDVFLIGFGFVLRVLSGTVVINVRASHWLLMCTFLLSLFLGFAKRRHEISVMGEGKNETRRVLSSYSTYFLDQMLAIINPSVFMCYILYTVDSETISKYKGEELIYTAPFVMYGIFRYQYLIYEKNEGNPTEIVYKDLSLIFCILSWLGLFIYITS